MGREAAGFTAAGAPELPGSGCTAGLRWDPEG